MVRNGRIGDCGLLDTGNGPSVASVTVDEVVGEVDDERMDTHLTEAAPLFVARYDILAVGACNLDIFAAVGDAPHALSVGEERVVPGVVETFLAQLASAGAAPFHVSGGGQAANVAVAVAGAGGRSALVTRVGDDASGRLVLSDLGKVDLTYVVRGPATTRALITVDGRGERTIVLDGIGEPQPPLSWPSPNAALHVHFTSMIAESDRLAQCAFRRRLPRSVTTSLDGGQMYAEAGLKLIEGIVTGATIYFATEGELQALAGCEDEAQSRLFELGVQFVCCKLGAQGARLTAADGSVVTSRPLPVTAVDSTGAGDVLAGVFLLNFVRRMPLQACLDDAVSCAAASVTGWGRSRYPGFRS